MDRELVPWRPATRAAFRFVFIWLGAASAVPAIALMPFGHFPPLAWLFSAYWAASRFVIELLSVHVLGVAPVGQLDGGSDSLAGWLQAMWTVILALVAAAIWTWRARQVEYSRLFDRHRVIVRYALAVTLLGYGFNKVVAIQFWQPTPSDLVQTFGSSSPFALVWRFMGASKPYMIFGGVLECVGAALLLWRRTTTLGALVLTTVMVNVVMLNFCYGIPVKNYSSILLVMSLYLLVPEARRLVDLLVLHRPVEPTVLCPHPLRPRWARIRAIAKPVIVVFFLGGSALDNVRRAVHHHGDAARQELYGYYDVVSFERDGRAVPLVVGDASLWQQVAFGHNWTPVMLVVTADGERRDYDLVVDKDKQAITLEPYDQSPASAKQQLTYRVIDASHLELRGTWFGANLLINLRAHAPSHSELLDHEFQFVDDGGYWR